jgi:hypothetical protein
MRTRHAASFGQGLLAGFGASLLGLALLAVLTGSSGGVVAVAVEWTARNLGLAAAAFALVAVAWLRSLFRLRDALAGGGAADTVAHYDLLSDVWVGLFFGVGVIWTAIGMRAALLEAIGPGSAGGDGAAMLARLVDGGILLSLSTTIVGGIGGYLMRVVRTLWLGPRLRRFYLAEANRDTGAVRASLSAIERRLDTVIGALHRGSTSAARPGPRRSGGEGGGAS